MTTTQTKTTPLSAATRAKINAISARHLVQIEALDREFAAMEPGHRKRARAIRDSHKRASATRAAIDRDDAFLQQKQEHRKRREGVTT